jgi:predicted membrane-bound spermidine synthase
MPADKPWLKRFLLPLFFLSGLASLVEQVAWQRLLGLFVGTDVASATVVVSAFMAGLGAGSLAGGRLAGRLEPQRRLRAFAAAEAGIGACVLLSVPLYHGLLYPWLGGAPWLPVAALVFATLLLPTALMGLSLPLLAQCVVDEGARAEEGIAALYGVNTLGAACGAALAPFALLRSLGLDGTLLVAAGLNLACAAGGLLLARRPLLVRPVVQEPAGEGDALSFRGWLAVAAVSGFVALSLEIVWLRVLGVLGKSNSFTFPLLLGLYLGGIGLGSLLGRPLARRSRAPGRGFLLLQWAGVVYAGGALAVFARSAGQLTFPWSATLWGYLRSYEPIPMVKFGGALLRSLQQAGSAADHELARLFVLLYVAAPLLLAGPATLLLGLSFPFLQRAVQTDPSLVGRRVGWLSAANIAGSALGSALTGVLLFSWLGSAGSLRLLLLLAACLPLLGGGRRPTHWLATALACVLAALAPDTAALWSSLHLARPEHVAVAEDATGVALIKTPAAGTRGTVVYVGGLGQSGIPYGDVHTILGALPVLLHPDPRRVLVVGLGSGDTAYAALARPQTRVDCVEIVGALPRALRALLALTDPAGPRHLLAEPRLRLVIDDGRGFLLRSQGRYDVIEADALRPSSAFAGNLYSREYFTLVRSRLAPGGLAVTWAPTPRSRDTFGAVFPHVLQLDTVLLGAETPLPWEPQVMGERLRQPATLAHFRRGEVAVEAALGAVLASQPARPAPPVLTEDLDTDLFPRDEYEVPQR